ncbi:hypothetical protein VTJ04DRAFT_711 [Mycothermus thermophilus]|uniref:uncharacterized protein n=1 Tax=Humicola insolens TaxID=85995 RepID=UPI0037436D39
MMMSVCIASQNRRQTRGRVVMMTTESSESLLRGEIRDCHNTPEADSGHLAPRSYTTCWCDDRAHLFSQDATARSVLTLSTCFLFLSHHTTWPDHGGRIFACISSSIAYRLFC